MAKYVLFLRGDPSKQSKFVNMSAEEMQKVVAGYRAWIGGLAGKMVGGEKLTDEGGKRMRRDGDGVVVTDGPYTEAKDVLGGYFVVEAGSYDEAVELAKGCPHLEFGPIEVRQVDISPS